MGANAHELYLVNMEDGDKVELWAWDLHWTCMQ